MAKQTLGNKTGTCTICGINFWDTNNGQPIVRPCGVNSCPYETAEQQSQIGLNYSRSDIGNSLQLTIYQS